MVAIQITSHRSEPLTHTSRHSYYTAAGLRSSTYHRYQLVVRRTCCPHLWCEVVWSTAQSPGIPGTYFGKSKIGYLDMSVRVQQDILRFEVAIYDPEGM